jgi:polyhydroxyalkanoate synthesis repressor PhaR
MHERGREFGICSPCNDLLLPKLDIPTGQSFKIRGLGHGPTIQGSGFDAIAEGGTLERLCCGAPMLVCCAAFVQKTWDGQSMNAKSQSESAPVIIKKYANRRLYNTATSSYVTLENLSQMVRNGGDFIVYDAKNGEDITRSVLTQIIVEEEQKGQNLLPISFLRQLISFYGNNMQWLVPRYLEYAMKSFSRNQEQLTKNVGVSFGGLFPFAPLEEVGKQNMALFEKAMKMFSPFGPEDGETPAAPATQPTPAADATAQSLLDLTQRLNQLQNQLDAISRKDDKA